LRDNGDPGYVAIVPLRDGKLFKYIGGAGAARAVSQLRAVMAYLQVATVQNQVQLSLMTDFENFNVFKPAEHHEKSVNTMLDQLVAWAGALKLLRQ
jgi:NAD(P)H-dependent FMN reductase